MDGKPPAPDKMAKRECYYALGRCVGLAPSNRPMNKDWEKRSEMVWENRRRGAKWPWLDQSVRSDACRRRRDEAAGVEMHRYKKEGLLSGSCD